MDGVRGDAPAPPTPGPSLAKPTDAHPAPAPVPAPAPTPGPSLAKPGDDAPAPAPVPGPSLAKATDQDAPVLDDFADPTPPPAPALPDAPTTVLRDIATEASAPSAVASGLPPVPASSEEITAVLPAVPALPTADSSPLPPVAPGGAAPQATVAAVPLPPAVPEASPLPPLDHAASPLPAAEPLPPAPVPTPVPPTAVPPTAAPPVTVPPVTTPPTAAPMAPAPAPAPPPPVQAQAPAQLTPYTPSRGSFSSLPVVDDSLAGAQRKPRHGEPLVGRALRAVRRTVSSSAAREVAEASRTAEVLQQPVSGGRQIAVTSIRGGAGKSTVAALLGTAYAHYRHDPVLLVEADPALGTLPFRLGAESLRWTVRDLAEMVEPSMSLLDVTGYLVQLPDNAWLLPGSKGEVGAMLDTKAYERAMVSLRRYFGVTVVDCETLPAEVARTALSAAHSRLLVAPATFEGVASTHSVLKWMSGLPRQVVAGTVVVLTEAVPHGGLDVDKAVQKLRATGAAVHLLPYDRHLAAGGAINTELLAHATREAVTRIAAEAFQLAQRRP